MSFTFRHDWAIGRIIIYRANIGTVSLEQYNSGRCLPYKLYLSENQRNNLTSGTVYNLNTIVQKKSPELVSIKET